MATNIEQIFRSFVVNKFKEIQEEKLNSDNAESSQNGELTQGKESTSEDNTVVVQREQSEQSLQNMDRIPSEPLALEQPHVSAVEDSTSKELKMTEVSSSDEVKKDGSRKKSKKHKKHKSKKKKKKKKKEKNEKRSKSTSSDDDQDDVPLEPKSMWKPAFASPANEGDKGDALSKTEHASEMDNTLSVPSCGIVQEEHHEFAKETEPSKIQADSDLGFFGPKCPNEINPLGSANLPTRNETEVQELFSEPVVHVAMQSKTKQLDGSDTKTTTQGAEETKPPSDASNFVSETHLPQPCLIAKATDSNSNKLESEILDQSSSLSTSNVVQHQPDNSGHRSRSKSASSMIERSAAKSRSRSKSITRKNRSRSKSLVKESSTQRISSKSPVVGSRTRSSPSKQRQRSRSSSRGRKRRSRSSTPRRYSISPIRSWWSKSIRNRERSRSLSVARRPRSRTRSAARKHRSKTRSPVRRNRSRSTSASRRRRSRSTSASRRRRSRSRLATRRQRITSRSGSRRRRSKSRSASRRRRSSSRTGSRRRRSRSRSASRRKRSKSRSVSRRRRSRSRSASRRRRRSRSRSASRRRRRSRSRSASRRRRSSRSRSASRRRRSSRSRSASRRRRSSRSRSASRRRRSSRSRSASRRRRRSRSRSVSRRRRSRSKSAIRRRSRSIARTKRSRSVSTDKKRRSKSPTKSRKSRSLSATKRHRLRSGSAARKRRSRSSSAGRKQRSRSRSSARKRRSRSVSRKQKSRSTSSAGGNQSRSVSVTKTRRSKSSSVGKRTSSSKGGSDDKIGLPSKSPVSNEKSLPCNLTPNQNQQSLCPQPRSPIQDKEQIPLQGTSAVVQPPSDVEKLETNSYAQSPAKRLSETANIFHGTRSPLQELNQTAVQEVPTLLEEDRLSPKTNLDLNEESHYSRNSDEPGSCDMDIETTTTEENLYLIRENTIHSELIEDRPNAADSIQCSEKLHTCKSQETSIELSRYHSETLESLSAGDLCKKELFHPVDVTQEGCYSSVVSDQKLVKDNDVCVTVDHAVSTSLFTQLSTETVQSRLDPQVHQSCEMKPKPVEDIEITEPNINLETAADQSLLSPLGCQTHGTFGLKGDKFTSAGIKEAATTALVEVKSTNSASIPTPELHCTVASKSDIFPLSATECVENKTSMFNSEQEKSEPKVFTTSFADQYVEESQQIACSSVKIPQASVDTNAGVIRDMQASRVEVVLHTAFHHKEMASSVPVSTELPQTNVVSDSKIYRSVTPDSQKIVVDTASLNRNEEATPKCSGLNEFDVGTAKDDILPCKSLVPKGKDVFKQHSYGEISRISDVKHGPFGEDMKALASGATLQESCSFEEMPSELYKAPNTVKHACQSKTELIKSQTFSPANVNRSELNESNENSVEGRKTDKVSMDITPDNFGQSKIGQNRSSKDKLISNRTPETFDKISSGPLVVQTESLEAKDTSTKPSAKTALLQREQTPAKQKSHFELSKEQDLVINTNHSDASHQAKYNENQSAAASVLSGQTTSAHNSPDLTSKVKKLSTHGVEVSKHAEGSLHFGNERLQSSVLNKKTSLPSNPETLPLMQEPSPGSTQKDQSLPKLTSQLDLQKSNVSTGQNITLPALKSVPLNFKFSNTFKPVSITPLHVRSDSSVSSDPVASSKDTSSTSKISSSAFDLTGAVIHPQKSRIMSVLKPSDSDTIIVPEPQETLKSSSIRVNESIASSETAKLHSSNNTNPLLINSPSVIDPVQSSIHKHQPESLETALLKPSQKGHQSEELPTTSELDQMEPASLHRPEPSQSETAHKPSFAHLSNATSKTAVKQRHYRSRSKAQESRSPSVDRVRPSRSRSKSTTRKMRSRSKSLHRKRRSSSARKRTSHSKSTRRRRSRSKSGGKRKRSKSKGRRKHSPSKLAGKRRHTRSKSAEKKKRSKSTERRKMRSKSPIRRSSSRSRSTTRKRWSPSKTGRSKASRSNSPRWRRVSRSKSASSKSRSRSKSASRKYFSKSRLQRRRSRSSTKSVSPRRHSQSRRGRRLSRSPIPWRRTRSRSTRRRTSRSRGRWRRSRSLSTSRNRSRSSSRLSRSLSIKKHHSRSKSPLRRRRSRSQTRQQEKSPCKSNSPLQKKTAQSKSTTFKPSIGLKSLIQKQLSQAKLQSSSGKLPSKEQVSEPRLTAKPQSNLSTKTQLPALIRAPRTQSKSTSGGQLTMPSTQLPMSNITTEAQMPVHEYSTETGTQLSMTELSTGGQWPISEMATGAQWPMSELATGSQWTMSGLHTGAHWPMSDLSGGAQWPMTDLTGGAQWHMSDLSATSHWAMPDMSAGSQWGVPDMAAGAQWAMHDMAAGSQWTVSNMATEAQWAMPHLTAGTHWNMPTLPATAQVPVPSLLTEAQVPVSSLADEISVSVTDVNSETSVHVPDLATEPPVHVSDLAPEVPVHVTDLAPEVPVPVTDLAPEVPVHVTGLAPEGPVYMTGLAAEVPVYVPDLAAEVPVHVPDLAAEVPVHVPDLAAEVPVHVPDLAAEVPVHVPDLAAEVPVHVPDLAAEVPVHVPDMAAEVPVHVSDLAAEVPVHVADLAAEVPVHLAAEVPVHVPDLAAEVPVHVPDVPVRVPDLAAEVPVCVPDLAAEEAVRVPDLAAEEAVRVPDLAAEEGVRVPDLAAEEAVRVPDLAAEVPVRVPDLAAEVPIHLATEAPVHVLDLAAEAPVHVPDLAAEAPAPMTDLTTETQISDPDIAVEALVPMTNMATKTPVPVPDLVAETSDPVPDLVAEAPVPVPDLVAEAPVPVPDLVTEAPVPVPDLVTEAPVPVSGPVESSVVNHSQPVQDKIIASTDHILHDKCPSSHLSKKSHGFFEYPLASEPYTSPKQSHLADQLVSVHDDDHNQTEPSPNPHIQQLAEPCPGLPLFTEATARRNEVILAKTSDNTVNVVLAETRDILQDTILVEPTDYSRQPFLSDSSDSDKSSVSTKPLAATDQVVLVEPYLSPDHQLSTERCGIIDSPAQTRPWKKNTNYLIDPCGSTANPLAEPCNSPGQNILVEPYTSPVQPLLVEPYASPEQSSPFDHYDKSDYSTPPESNSSADRPGLVEPYESPDRPILVAPYVSPDHSPNAKPHLSNYCPPFLDTYGSSDRSSLLEHYASYDHSPQMETYAHPQQTPLLETNANPNCSPIAEPYSSCVLPPVNEHSGSSSCSSHCESEVNPNCSLYSEMYTSANESLPLDELNTGPNDSLPTKRSTDSSLLTNRSVSPAQNVISTESCPSPTHLEAEPCAISSGSLPSTEPTDSPDIPLLAAEPHANIDQSLLAAENFASPSTSVGTADPYTSPVGHIVAAETFIGFSNSQVSKEQKIDCFLKASEPCSSPEDSQLATEPRPHHSLLAATTCSSLNSHLVAAPLAISHLLIPTPHASPSCPISEYCTSPKPQVDECYASADPPLVNEPCTSLKRDKPRDNLECQLTDEPLAGPDHPLGDKPSASPLLEGPCPNTSSPLVDNPCAGIGHLLDDLGSSPPISQPTNLQIHKSAVHSALYDKTASNDASCSSPKYSVVDETCDTNNSQENIVSCNSHPTLPSKPDQSSTSLLLERDSLEKDLSQSEKAGQPESENLPSSAEQPLLEKTNVGSSSTPLNEKSTSTAFSQMSETVVAFCATQESTKPLCASAGGVLTLPSVSMLSGELTHSGGEHSQGVPETDQRHKTSPPDLMPYDSEQPVLSSSVCEPLSEQVLLNSQPPPELLPYDTEQPANTYLSLSDYSSEQATLVFQTPPELLPYDSEQPTLLDTTDVQHSTKEISASKLSDCNCEAESSDRVMSPESKFPALNHPSVSSCPDSLKQAPEKRRLDKEHLSVADLPMTDIQLESLNTLSKFPNGTTCEKLGAVIETSDLPHYTSSDTILSPREKQDSVPVQPAEQAQLPAEERTETLLHCQITPDEKAVSLSTKTGVILRPAENDFKVPSSEAITAEQSTSEEQPVMLGFSEQSTERLCDNELVQNLEKQSLPLSISQEPTVSPLESSKRQTPSKSITKQSSSTSRSRRSRSRSLGRKKRSRSEDKRSRSRSTTRRKRSRSKSVVRRRRTRSKSATKSKRSRSKSTTRRKSRTKSPTRRRSRSKATARKRHSRSTSLARGRRSYSASPTRRRRSRSASPARRRRSRSASPARRRRSRSASPVRRRRSRSASPVRRRRSRSASPARRRRSRSASPARRRRSRSASPARRRRSRSASPARRRRSRSASPARRRRSRSASPARRRRSRSASPARRRRSRSASPARRRRSRSASPIRKRKTNSKSPIPKSPTEKQRAGSKSDRSRSPSQSNATRKRKTRSRSTSKDKNKSGDKRRKRSTSKDHYSNKSRRRSRTPPRRKKSRSPVRRAGVCLSPIRRRRSRSPIRRKSFSRSPTRRKRSRSREKSLELCRSPKRLTDLDKAQLLEIAKANAAAMCAKAGVPLPPSLKPAITPVASADEKIAHRTYGVTIQELTEKCKQIAQSKEDDVIVNKPHDSDDEEEERPFYNHPFKVNEHKPISFSLLNPSIKPAPKNPVTLTKEFPVSSGSQHRKKESDKVYGEWVPVDKKTEESKDDVFTNAGPSEPIDITAAMNERAIAQTRLNGNPFDLEALFMLNRAQEQIDAWAQSTSLPGQFTGSTGAQVLSADEISNSGPQAWLKKDQFLRAAPVSGGRGALLMRKMGWREGEGLGRHNEGNVNPILIDFKTDRKGLVADGEKAPNKLALPAMKDLSGKHPISVLMELCNKKKWSPPEFVLIDDAGPEHRKRFLFRVTVNGTVHQPSQPSVNKKLAKATAAAAALQGLGALSKESMTPTTSFRSASDSTS